jgi:hypothetical protein
VTASRKSSLSPRPPHHATTSPIPDPQRGRDPAEMNGPYHPPFPDDRWPRRPEYVIVVDQLRGWQPAQPPSLAELLETGHPCTPDPEPDLEAEP